MMQHCRLHHHQFSSERDSDIMTILVALLIVLFPTSGLGSLLDQCTSSQQMRILPNVLDCAPVEQTVMLDLPNDTFVHMVPNQVAVQRCGGSTLNRHHSCLPTLTRTKSVSVLLVPYTADLGSATSPLCVDAVVQEHLACEGRCQTTADMCTSDKHRFLQTECRCACANDAEREMCLSGGMHWDNRLCQCLCRDPTRIPFTCPSGYTFNGSPDTCACVSITDGAAEHASTLIEILVVIVTCSFIMTAVGVVQCKRYGVGLFAESQRRKSLDDDDQYTHLRHSTSLAQDFRTIFRQISSHSHLNHHGHGHHHQSRHPPLEVRNEQQTFLSPGVHDKIKQKSASAEIISHMTDL